MSEQENWVTNILKALNKWETSRSADDYQYYAITCATYLVSKCFKDTGIHWFCADKQTTKFATSSLVIFTFVPKNDPADPALTRLNLYIDSLNSTLIKCARCAKQYQKCQTDLANELNSKVCIPKEKTDEFLKMLHKLDKKRITTELEAHPDNIASTTEALWSNICITSSTFTRTVIYPIISNPDSVEKCGASPGFVLFCFNGQHATNKLAIGKIASNVEEFTREWESSSPQFSFVLLVGLRRNIMAQNYADFAWYTAFVLLKILGHNRSVARDITATCINSFGLATGLPSFGAHALMRLILYLDETKSSHAIDINEEAGSKNREMISLLSLEKALDYICGCPLEHKQLDPELPQSKSTGYGKLSASSAVKWFKSYVNRHPDTANLIKRAKYILDLKQDAFSSVSEYDEAAKAVAKSISINPSDLWKIMIEYSDRLVDSFQSFDATIITRLWSYQIKRTDADEWSPFWFKVIRHSVFTKSVSLGTNDYFEIARSLLESSKDVSIIWQLPKKADRPNVNETGNKNVAVSQPELFITELLDYLSDFGLPESLSKMLLNSKVLESCLLLYVSGNKKLGYASNFFMQRCFQVDSKQAVVNHLVLKHPELMLAVLNSIIADATPAEVNWLSVLSGILQLSLLSLDQVFSTTDGLDTAGNKGVLHLLHNFWNLSWKLVANVLVNIRPWAQVYSTIYVKEVLTDVLYFSQELLNKFRVLDADLSSGLESETKWGSELAQPVISSVNNMGDLLQLAIPELLAKALNIIIDILALMKSFSVPIPDSLSTLFENLATRKLNSKLTKDQLRDLLQATGLNDIEVQEVLERKKTLTDSGGSKASVPRVSSNSSSQTRQQSSIGDFFKMTNGTRPPVPSQPIIAGNVQPSTPKQVSNISLIKAQLQRQQMSTHKADVNMVIHPERPPGFNPRKSSGKVNNESEDSSEDSDDESALKALGAKQKQREEAEARLRDAYKNNKSRPDIIVNGSSMNRRQVDDKEREKRLMKARLSVLPTALHAEVLSWDYFAEKPPFKANTSVPDTFSTVEEYERIMAPLLYLEAWEVIKATKEELERNEKPPVALITGRCVRIDQFVDVYVSVQKEAFSKASLAEGDILLLTYDKGNSQVLVKPHKDLPHCFARIKEGSIRRQNKQYVDFEIRTSVDSNVLNRLPHNSTISALSLNSMNTVEREFTALMALKYYDLQQDVLNAQPSAASDDPSNMDALQKNLNLNRSQATAVHRSLSTNGFKLIQGPPGTGKTKTIVAIVGAYFTNNSLVSNALGNQNSSEKKMLICAPSNAAVDEIVLRLKNGVTNAEGIHQDLNILRMGRLEMISEQVRDVTLDAKVEKLTNQSAEPADEQLRKDHTALTVERNELRNKLQNSDIPLSATEISSIEKQITDLNASIREKNFALDMQRNRLDEARKKKELRFREEQRNVMEKAQVVLTTLSASAHPLLASLGATFNTVIIDEAAQCIELSALIPLKYGCKRCIMVGDPNQLPPTVISQVASKLKYEQSLFVRMYNLNRDYPGAVSMLDTQFRMHPEISKFPSREFYAGKLKNGDGLAQKLARPWHAKYSGLGPYMFYEVRGKHERGGGHSLKNMAEVYAAVELTKFLKTEFKKDEIGSIGVISPYREQVRVLRSAFINSFGAEITSSIDFNSIDGFQGQEKDIIIFSCVRASNTSSGQSQSVGFVGDIRRMNVAITRAKSSLWILGDPNSLMSNPVWKELIDDAKDRGCLLNTSNESLIKAIKKFDSFNRKRSYDDDTSTLPRKIVEHQPEFTEIPVLNESMERNKAMPTNSDQFEIKKELAAMLESPPNNSNGEVKMSDSRTNRSSVISPMNRSISEGHQDLSNHGPSQATPHRVPERKKQKQKKSIFIPKRGKR